MRALFGVTHAMFVIPEAGRVRFLCESADDSTLRRLVQLTTAEDRSGRLRALDPLVDAWFERRSQQRVEVYDEALNDRMLDHRLDESVMVTEALRPGGFHNFLGFMTAVPGHELMLFMGHERRGRTRFGGEELAVLAALLPAFRAGHHALLAFGSRRAALAATLDQMSEPLLVAGPDGREWHRNAALRRLLELEPERERMLGAVTAAAARLIGRDARPHPGVIVRRDVAPLAATSELTTATARYVLRATFVPPEIADGRGVLVSVECSGARMATSESALTERFGLTPREVQVARALERRLSNAEIARALGISQHTALRHTERVLSKLGVHSRREVAERLATAAS
jgi:DNA-binding CsgD family transcriptional regulator